MNLVAIIGSLRKGKNTDTLVDRAIEGALSKKPDLSVKKIYLIDHNIQYCTNCMSCHKTPTADDEIAPCCMHDDMDQLNQDLINSHYLIYGTPLHMGYVTAPMLAFLERTCWTFAKPQDTLKFALVKGCPTSRLTTRRRSITIVANGAVPPIFRWFCDYASPMISYTIRDTLNAKTVGSLYAGNLVGRGGEYYSQSAFNLGKKLCAK